MTKLTKRPLAKKSSPNIGNFTNDDVKFFHEVVLMSTFPINQVFFSIFRPMPGQISRKIKNVCYHHLKWLRCFKNAFTFCTNPFIIVDIRIHSIFLQKLSDNIFSWRLFIQSLNLGWLWTVCNAAATVISMAFIIPGTLS